MSAANNRIEFARPTVGLGPRFRLAPHAGRYALKNALAEMEDGT